MHDPMHKPIVYRFCSSLISVFFTSAKYVKNADMILTKILGFGCFALFDSISSSGIIQLEI